MLWWLIWIVSVLSDPLDTLVKSLGSQIMTNVSFSLNDPSLNSYLHQAHQEFLLAAPSIIQTQLNSLKLNASISPPGPKAIFLSAQKTSQELGSSLERIFEKSALQDHDTRTLVKR